MQQETVLTDSRNRRWAEEEAFFNAEAGNISDTSLSIDHMALARYGRATRRRFNKEFRFKIMGPLAGKRILDVGCGSGQNAVQLAKLGASVTGIDLSSKEIEIAQRRAQINGVSNRVTLKCSPIEIADMADNTFDIIWVDAVLHHLLDELDLTLRRLVGWVRPDGLLVFAEPVNLFEPLRRLRKLAPARADVTPGERPLVQTEVDSVLHYLDDPKIRYFMLFGRFDQFILTRYSYERSSLPRKILSNAIALLDYALLSLPGIRRLAGACVIYARPNKAALYGKGESL